MAWKWVAKIKNGVDEYNFVVPLVSLSSFTVGSTSYDQISNNAYRSNAAQFTLVSAMLNDANSQKTRNPSIYNSYIDGSINKFVYGDSGGTALQIVNTRSISGSNESNSFKPYRYLSFSSNNQIANSTLNLDITVKAEGNFCGVALAMNDETHQIYLASVDGQIYYRNDDHTPNSQDYVYFRIRIYHNSIASTDDSNLWNIFKNSIPSGGGGDPYHTDDYDEPIQGDASYDDSTDTVENPALPVVTANTSGFVTAFVPSIGELNALANYLISPTFGQAIAGSSLLSGFKEMILGLQIFPCTVPAESPERVYCYLPGTKLNTGCDMGRASNQFVEIDCGDLEVEEYWGNCCDYNPYTAIGIFLPFCGFYDLDTDDVMGKTLNVSYRIDIMSGACLATIKIDGSVMYQYSGTCSAQIPLNSTSFDEFFKSMIEMGCATATGGAGLIAAGSAMDVGMARAADISKKNMKLAGRMGVAANDAYESAKINSQTSVVGATANAVIGSKGRYKHAGALGSSIGFLGVRKPYLIIKRPHQQIPDMYGKFHGYPSFTKANLGDLEGYTVVDDIRLNIPDATVEEIIECEKLLKEGVVL